MNYFFCLRKSDDNCPKTLLGQIACETCQENKCKNCGRLNTNFCLKCEKNTLSDEMKQKLKDEFLRRRNA